MTYQTKVYRQHGGSELSVASGGSISVEAGGTTTFAAGASVTINTTVSGTGFRLDLGGSTPSIGGGPNVPTHSAPMGSLYIRSNGSISGLYINITQDAAGSTWRGFQQGSAIS